MVAIHPQSILLNALNNQSPTNSFLGADCQPRTISGPRKVHGRITTLNQRGHSIAPKTSPGGTIVTPNVDYITRPQAETAPSHSLVTNHIPCYCTYSTMPSKSLAKTLFPFAGASATQPRNKIRSSFSPLVGWLTSLWASKRQKKAKKNRSLVAEPHHSTSPVTVHEEPETPPTIDTTDGFGTTSRDDANGDDDHDASEMPHPLSQYFERRLTKEELDYAATALLQFLEEGKAASPGSGHEEYEYCAPAHTGRRLRHGLWCAPFLWSPASFDTHLRF